MIGRLSMFKAGYIFKAIQKINEIPGGGTKATILDPLKFKEKL